eukprot:5249177-Prymnesium_polylepis.1
MKEHTMKPPCEACITGDAHRLGRQRAEGVQHGAARTLQEHPHHHHLQAPQPAEPSGAIMARADDGHAQDAPSGQPARLLLGRCMGRHGGGPVAHSVSRAATRLRARPSPQHRRQDGRAKKVESTPLRLSASLADGGCRRLGGHCSAREGKVVDL